VEADPTRRCEILVNLLDVDIKGVEGTHRQSVTVHFEYRRAVTDCPERGVVARVEGPLPGHVSGPADERAGDLGRLAQTTVLLSRP
jgi:hypothetical protein